MTCQTVHIHLHYLSTTRALRHFGTYSVPLSLSTYTKKTVAMEVISQRSSSLSTLNPSAQMFIPFAYRTVEDFSDQWWALIQSSPWFRDYWLQERYFDPQNDPLFSDLDDLVLLDVDEFFHHEIQQEEKEEREFCRDLVSLGTLKWKKGRDLFEKPMHAKKAPKIVNVKVSPRTIQQPR